MIKPKKPVNEPATPVGPAPKVARSEDLRYIEEGERNFNYVVKKYYRDGPDGALKTLESYKQEGYDPSEHSMGAVASVRRVDDWIDHGEAFSGRKSGARAPETLYLGKLMDHLPHEDTRGLWHALRTVIDDNNNRRNPTPGECPFSKGYDKNGKLVPLKRGKPYGWGTFRSALSEIRQRRAPPPK